MSELKAELRPKNSTTFWRLYMLSWALLASSALTYMFMHTGAPGNLNSQLAEAADTVMATNRAEIEREKLNEQVRSLNDTVASLRSELTRIKKQSDTGTTVASNTAPSQTPEHVVTKQPEQIASQEVSNITTSSLQKPEVPTSSSPTANKTELAPTQPVTIVNAAPSATTAAPTASPAVVAPTAAAPATDTPPIRPRNLATALLRPGKVPPLPPYNAQQTSAITKPFASNSVTNVAAVVNQSVSDAARKSVPVTNTAVAAAPRATTFGAPVVKPRQPAGSAALSLSTAQSVTGLRASWLLLTTRHPNVFVGYQPRYVADQINGNYRLLAGPIANHSDADRICTQLRSQNVSCGVTAYVGSAL